jgi:hypothetical protein
MKEMKTMRKMYLFGYTMLFLAAFGRAETIRSGDMSADFDPASGRLTFARAGKVFASAAFAEPGKAKCEVESVSGRQPLGPGKMLKIGPGENRVLVREGSPFIYVRNDPRGVPASSNRVDGLIATLDLGVAPEKVRVVGAAGVFQPQHNRGQHVVTGVAVRETGAGVVAGLVRIDAASGVALTKVEQGKVVLTLRDEYGCAIPPKLEPFGGDWWALGAFDDVRVGLETYATEFARVNQCKPLPAPVGYMSWYSQGHGGALTEKYAPELAEFVANTFKDYGYSVVQLDDGWQSGAGSLPVKDFTKVNPKGPYPNGMKPVADKIRSLGLTPGLWYLPFAINANDPSLAHLLPWTIKSPTGEPYRVVWSGTPLDMSIPQARDYVANFIRQGVRDWGFNYLKLDGLHIALATPQTYPNRFYCEDHFGESVLADKTMSNMQAARAGFRAVREAAGPETFILGCCAPQNQRSMGMSMGFVDAMRLGIDSEASWRLSLNGVQAGSALYFLNGRVWWNDPDSIALRSTWTLNEIQCFAGWVTLAGMLNTQCDWAPNYPAERVELLKRTMPSHQLTSVRPLDYLENDPARIWVLTYEVSGRKHEVVGLFNWTDKELDLGASATRLGLKAGTRYAGYEFWSNSLLVPFQGELKQTVPARTGRIIAVREIAEEPAVLSTSRHVTQGAVDLIEEKWDARKQRLTGASKLVANDPYELRVLTGAKALKAVGAELSKADTKAGVSVSYTQEAGLVRVNILSPKNGTVRWSLGFKERNDL